MTVLLPGLFGAAVLTRMSMKEGAQHRTLWFFAVIAWAVALSAVFAPFTVKFLEPYTWSAPLKGAHHSGYCPGLRRFVYCVFLVCLCAEERTPD